MAFQKDTLGDTTVFNLVLNDMKCIIIKIVVDSTLSNSVVFIRVFNNWFLEVSTEIEDLFYDY